jgi:hypothetical protein
MQTQQTITLFGTVSNSTKTSNCFLVALRRVLLRLANLTSEQQENV